MSYARGKWIMPELISRVGAGMLPSVCSPGRDVLAGDKTTVASCLS